VKITRNGILGFLAALSLILAYAAIAAAQDDTNQTIKPPTMGKTHRRAARPKPVTATAGGGDTSAPAQTTSPMDGGKDTDLSGTYMGMVDYPDGSMKGDATLTITGNTFTLVVTGGTPISGRISAVETRGYIGVTMRMGDQAANDKVASEPVPTVSVRARKMGKLLTLMSVPEETHKFSFMPEKMTKKERMMMCKPM
jgi:hypothetical protein